MESGKYVLKLVDPLNTPALMVTLLFSTGYLTCTLTNMCTDVVTTHKLIFPLEVAFKCTCPYGLLLCVPCR